MLKWAGRLNAGYVYITLYLTAWDENSVSWASGVYLSCGGAGCMSLMWVPVL